MRKRPDFLRVQRRGRRTKSRDLVVCWGAGAGESARFGFTVSKKVGNAVTRNQVRRWLRESVRRRKADAPPVDIVFIARNSAANAGFRLLDQQVAVAVRRIARMEGPSATPPASESA